MAVQQSNLLARAFESTAQNDDARNIDFRQWDKMSKDLSTEINRINKDNFDKFKYLNKQQDEMLKTINLDLSKVNPAHRKELQAIKLSQLKEMSEKGTYQTMSDIEFKQKSNAFAQEVAISKSGYETTKLSRKQMAENKDFNTRKNREAVDAYEKLTLAEQKEAEVPILKPYESRQFAKISTSLWDVVKTTQAKEFSRNGLYGIEDETTYVNGEIDDEIDKWLLGTDTYGNANTEWVYETYLENNKLEEATQEEAEAWFRQEVKDSRPLDTQNVTKVGQISTSKKTTEAEGLSQITIAKGKAIAKSARDLTQNFVSDNNFKPISTDSQVYKNIQKKALLDDIQIKNLWRPKSINASVRTAIGGDFSHNVYKMETLEGDIRFFSYGRNRNKGFDMSSPRNASDIYLGIKNRTQAGVVNQEGYDYKEPATATFSGYEDATSKAKKARVGTGVAMKRIGGIVIHHTAGKEQTIDDMIKTFQGTRKPAHWTMDRKGRVFRVLPEGEQGVHSGAGTGDYKGYGNSTMEGIEVMAQNNDDWTDAQIKAFPSFIKWHSDKYKYDPIKMAVGHGVFLGEGNGHKQMVEGKTGKDAFLAWLKSGGTGEDSGSEGEAESTEWEKTTSKTGIKFKSRVKADGKGEWVFDDGGYHRGNHNDNNEFDGYSIGDNADETGSLKRIYKKGEITKTIKSMFNYNGIIGFEDGSLHVKLADGTIPFKLTLGDKTMKYLKSGGYYIGYKDGKFQTFKGKVKHTDEFFKGGKTTEKKGGGNKVSAESYGI